jgi:hypothetical protein
MGQFLVASRNPVHGASACWYQLTLQSVCRSFFPNEPIDSRTPKEHLSSRGFLSCPLGELEKPAKNLNLFCRETVTIPEEANMHGTKERLSLFWIFTLLNYLYADVVALFAIAGSPDSAPHLPQWALLGSAVLMEIPIAMILASRLLRFRANRLANIIAGSVMTLVNGFLTFVLPLANGAFRDPVYPAYVFFATIETVATSYIVWRAWTWSETEAAVSSERIVRQPEAGKESFGRMR